MASSRLERLFTLLATSTSGPTLSLASQQLAQVVRTHPEELCGLLAHLHPLLHSSTWETRLAAVQALTAILKAYPAEPRPVQAAGKEDARVKLEAPVDLSYGRESRQTPVIVSAAQVDQFNFETFDLARMIAETESLLSSRGREFNSPAQCDLGQQKKEINRKFGFTMAQNLAGDTAPDDLITEEDLKVENGSAGAGPTLSSALSARERNRLKRAASRQKTQVQTSQKKAKKEAKLYKAPRAPTDPDEWVFQPFCQYLCRDLFDEAWEVRHGAATALREIIAHQGQRAGCHGQHSAVENANAHRAWLAQISLRLITVMAKDRFGDFVSDQVVAPVRESSAQALAEAVTLMTPSDVSQVVRVILQLLANPDWQCRHGGLLGVSYDVVGVAAASLIPVVRELILKYQNQLEKLTDRLWDALKIIDDLTSSTHSIMHLLSEILKTQVEYGQIERLNLFQSNGGLDHQSMFALKVVRLFPFMSHSSSLVRKATLTTLNTLTEHQDLAKIVLPTVVKELSLNLFQRAIPSYDETRQAASQLQNETVDYIALLKHYKLQLAPDLISLQPKTFSIDQVQMFLTRTDFGSLFGSNPKLKTKLLDSLLDRKNALVGSLNRIANDQATLTVMTQAANAGAIGSKRTKKTAPNATNGKSQPSPAEIEESKRLQVQSRGAQMALEKIIRHFHAQVFIKLPKLHELTLKGVLSVMSEYQNQSPELVTCLRALEVSMPVLALDLQDALLLSVPNLVTLLKSPLASIRHMSARCLAILAKIRPMAVMVCVIEQILPLFNSDVVAHRQGAIECLACIVEKLDVQVLPYIALLVVPCMGRMSDFDQDIRLLASNTFAVLIRLIPLDGAVPEPLDLPKAIVQRKAQDQRFLDQLMNIGQLEDYQLAFPIEATLRSYQKNGLNWLAFLNRYRLHGILCDDMGLGKTLQTICMLASSHFHLQPRGFHDQSVDCLSLVICPPTLCSHWVAEIHRFVGKSILQPLIYSGPLATRAELRPLFSEFNVIITSYDVVRNDVDYFGRIAWNYVILDEGHVIKNGRTKTTLAIKSLQAQHRLILSGTPIQNSVLELWSLFDFLMNYAKYSRPIVASRDPKCSPKDQEAGALAMEALHRQVLPFILRRMKEDVLSDLPPKITQDYYCELSQIQIKLYEDFARTQSNKHRQQGDEALNLSKKDPQPTPANKPHIFQALQYLRKVCNHPKLVLNEQHPEFDAVMGMLQVSNSNLNDINHSGKLPALHDLLLQCGIGAQSSSNSLDDSVVVQHRALVFFQLKSMMDIVENDLLKRLMPSVTYLRLDGSVPAHARQGIVDRFNNDISYDLLLLSTSVGGLGLNLTGADTVIFVEHDWNPMKDLQAMDRAHRIGQKKVVNVYRLITRNTIEEKILGLQKFKMITANTVISSDNASLHSMATDQIFDLFSLEDNLTAGDNRNGAMDQQRQQQQQGIKALLDNMPELWDERQYEDEYDLNAYISKKHASNGKEHASHPLESPSTSKEVHHSNNQTLN
ncbi:hypothetical protein TCAL_11089 [Tigriopus californicus]|uniref:TATA-binding protein-associated factor 172 n=1 Tax=Tigriopus californicus TaxID=6832 RepID=A0A553P7M6_TIGCA|nr:hypothetical protein TCAL_11089 [Tigriopus californicus]|eukprot:TCALIF_11089-PA protein Name:"Similar to BTAF1 TATA-binding protein-associated factor 172 (Homo sapiens)" AED:0.09 eAED:0.09 QI:0/0/0/1/1/1/7/0/1501